MKGATLPHTSVFPVQKESDAGFEPCTKLSFSKTDKVVVYIYILKMFRILQQRSVVARNFIFSLISEMLWSETGYFGILGNKPSFYIILLYLIER